jgi:hypothetical protein
MRKGKQFMGDHPPNQRCGEKFEIQTGISPSYLKPQAMVDSRGIL